MLTSPEDQQTLWENLHVIDCFATDHAPHTLDEKLSDKAPPGFPGLETILPLLLNAVNEGRLTMEDIVNKFHKNPKRIFNLPDQPNTYVEVDMDEEWVIPEAMPYSKAGWTPFAGKHIKGSIHRVVLRGEVAYVEGQILVQPGFGQNVREWEKRVPSVLMEFSRPPSALALDRSISPAPYPLNGFVDRIDYDNDKQTNEIFSRLLSADNKVHFAGAETRSSPVLPIIPRIRTESFSTTERRVRTESQSNAEVVTQAQSALLHPHHGLANKHILSVDMFTKDQLNDIFNLAQTFRVYVTKDRPLDHILRGKVMASIFYEVSTRTCCSFSTAMQRLGGRVIYMDETSSSVKKGETLEDSVAVMAGYADVVVLRHPAPGSVLVSTYTN